MSRLSIFEKNKIVNVLFGMVIIILSLWIAHINLVQYKVGLNADVASDGLLASIMWKSKQWIPEEWYVASETRLMGIANVAAIFYGLTNNMCLSMGLACMCGSVFIIGSLLCLCKALEYDCTQSLLFACGILILPNNKEQLELLYIYAGYYAFHIGLYFITLSIYVNLLKRKKINNYGIIIVFGMCFIFGAQGVRGILMITGPLLAVELLRRIYEWYCNGRIKKEDQKVTVFVFLLNFFSFLGSMLPVSVGYPLSRNIRNAPQKFLKVVIPDFFAAMYWKELSLLEKTIWVGCLLTVVYFTVSILFKGCKKQIVKEEEWVYLNFVTSVFLTIAALTFTTVGSSSRYFTVIFFAIAMGISKLWKNSGEVVKGFLGVGLFIILICNCIRIYYPLATDKGYADSDYIQISNYLVEEGYENAYTTFDHANVMTVMGDGQVQVSAVSSLSTMEVNKWLSSRNWYVPNVRKESKTAYIVSDVREAEFDEFLQVHHNDIEFKIKIGGFSIYGSDINFSKLTD